MTVLCDCALPLSKPLPSHSTAATCPSHIRTSPYQSHPPLTLLPSFEQGRIGCDRAWRLIGAVGGGRGHQGSIVGGLGWFRLCSSNRAPSIGAATHPGPVAGFGPASHLASCLSTASVSSCLVLLEEFCGWSGEDLKWPDQTTEEQRAQVGCGSQRGQGLGTF